MSTVVDISAAVKELGLRKPPHVVMRGYAGQPALFRPEANVINVDIPMIKAILSDKPGHGYTPSAIHRTHADVAARGFTTVGQVIAHELYHAKQGEAYPSPEAFAASAEHDNFLEMVGLITHAEMPLEQEADAWAIKQGGGDLVKVTNA